MTRFLGKALLVLVVLAVIAPAAAIVYSGAPLTAPPGIVTRVVFYLTDNRVSTVSGSAWPERQPMEVSSPPDQTFAAARRTVRALGWQVISMSHGGHRLSAVDRTPLLGFEDDVSLRVEAEDESGRSVVHLRSASRVGQADFGRNTARIVAFRQALRKRLDTGG
ncbi:hypothetical protein KBTX_04056 [wastewater metagenome]|uniref:DUF1499 domain-containing protein n=2 Tax=unclassified sequences TaxID=12908 RepID=A0A5B8RKF2_9ZZZZ|nr:MULTISPECIES: DUF1499 domain-containing protein [Arhodomonas]MCS4503284.1 DUF1499 domain-containing protein [Arhodomonas aquaeolei]QEA07695.1 hypothetical protein KBTEX_04056 [uncultured organism]